MKTYNYIKTQSPDSAAQQLDEHKVEAIASENVFAKAAYEWNYALRLAAERMWGPDS